MSAPTVNLMLDLEQLDRLAVALTDDWRSLVETADGVRGHPSERIWRAQAELSAELYQRVVILRDSLR